MTTKANTQESNGQATTKEAPHKEATMKATTKVTQDGKTTVIKVRVANSDHLGKIQVSGANETEARANLEALLQVAKSKTQITFA